VAKGDSTTMNEKTVKHLISIFNDEQMVHVLQGSYDELVKLVLAEPCEEQRAATVKQARIIELIKEEIERRKG
jgi:hypothetical protein